MTLGPCMIKTGIVPDSPALSQGHVGTLWAPDVLCPNIETTGFWLMTIEQAEDAQFLKDKDIGLIVTILGHESRQPRYPVGVTSTPFLVTWGGGRRQQLQDALPLIVAALSQGLNVGVHCLQSFHRGPMALCAIVRSLFCWDPIVTLKYIGTKREIYGPYATGEPLADDRLADALAWVKTLEQWVTAVDSRGRGGQTRSGGPVPAHINPKAAALSQVQKPPWRAGAVSASSAAASSSAAAPAQKVLKGTKPVTNLDSVCEYLFRAMKQDGGEFEGGRPMRTLEGEALVREIFRAVEEGSRERSSFLHFSRDFVLARTWFVRGRDERRERGGYLCRIKLADLRALEERTRAASSQGVYPYPASQVQTTDADITARVGSVFDLSSELAIKKTFGKTQGSSTFVGDNAYKLRVAMANKEVLVAFRGDIPATMFDLIDSNTGEYIRPLSSTIVAKVAAAGRGPRFFHTSHSQYSTVQIVYGTVLYCSVCTVHDSLSLDLTCGDLEKGSTSLVSFLSH